jgi:diacylglycerol kinase family enzyme
MAGIAVVLNDSSGGGNGAAVTQRLQTILGRSGREVEITVAQGGSEIRTAMQRAVDQGCDTLVAAGGDGTINTAAQLLAGSELRLGILPLGTLNHFAKDLGIPTDLEAAAEVVLGGSVCRVDVGQVNDRVFLNNSSLGAYPAIVRLRERYQAGGMGKWIAALWATLAVMRRHPFLAVRLTVEEEAMVRRTPFVLVGNNQYRMVGLHAASREALTKGELAVYVLNAERRRGLLRLAWQVLVQGVDRVQELDLFTVAEATIETSLPRIQVALDGEVTILDSPLHYRTRASALQVLVPAESVACDPHPFG